MTVNKDSSPAAAAEPFPYTIHVQDMSCEHCRQTVESAARGIAGVVDAQVDLAAATLQVRGGDPQAVMAAVQDAGYPAWLAQEHQVRSCPLPGAEASQEKEKRAAQSKTVLLRVGDMHCASCVGRVEQALLAVPGVTQASVNLVDQSATVAGGDPQQIVLAVNRAGYSAELQGQQRPPASEAYEIDILGMHCASCVSKVEQAITSTPGVTEASVSLIEKKALVRGGSPDQVVQAIVAQGYGAVQRDHAAADQSFYLRLQPPATAEDLEQITDILLAQDEQAELVPEAQGRLRIHTHTHPADVLLRLADLGYQATLEEVYTDPAELQDKQTRLEIRRSWQRALLAATVGFGVMAGHMSGLFPTLQQGRGFWAGVALLCLVTMYFSGRTYFAGAWKQARHGSANMDTLVALGTGAAWLSSVLVIADPDFIPGGGNHLYLDASVMILAFLQLGHALETKAKRTTSEAIGSLIGLRARTAMVVRAAGHVEIPLSLLRSGDRLRVKPGEKVPNDGVVIEGRTTIDESMLTGEPLPVVRQVGDTVTGGTMNRSGVFVLKVTRLGDDTTLARIISMVKNAQISKPPIGRLVDRIAAVFVPVVLVIAVATFAAWWLIGPEPRMAFAMTTAIAVLVIACPCALGLATPIAIMVGTSRAAQCNVLIRNSDALQTASKLTHVVVDKTGTLTEGKPSVRAVFPVEGWTERELLRWAASLESGSEHPLAEAVLAAQQQFADPLPALTNFTALSGRGVQAEQEGTRYFLGNHHFVVEQGATLPADLKDEAERQAGQGGTPVWLGRDDQVLGLLVLKDAVRKDSAEAIRALHRLGIQVVMCTGDNTVTAKAVAREVGITEVHSEIMPEAKLQLVADLQERGFKVGMVGDGVNDAPALAQADTGFAIGSGTDVAIENADITLAGDSLALVATAIAISGATIRNIRQNLFGAFIYNLIGIPLAAGLLYPLTGSLLQPMFASAAMALSSVTVVTNANRLRFFQPK